MSGSTTLFRTVLNAGFPVVERIPHAYRVSYYEEIRADSDPIWLAWMRRFIFRWWISNLKTTRRIGF